MKKHSIYVDFDGTICPNGDKMIEYPPPTEECIKVLTNLQQSGYEIVIYSVRSNQKQTNKVNGHKLMIEYLKQYRVPYDRIDYSKSHFFILIDDKCCNIPKDKNGNVVWHKLKF